MTLQQQWVKARWSLTISGDRVRLMTSTGERDFIGTEAARLSVVRRWFTWRLIIEQREPVRLGGCSKSEAQAIQTTLARQVSVQAEIAADSARRRHLAALKAASAQHLPPVMGWHREVRRCLDSGVKAGRWIPHDDVESLISQRPRSAALDELMDDPAFMSSLTGEESLAIAALRADQHQERRRLNASILRSELASNRSFFDTIEKSPLTDEQARAVVTFDNRVQVVAAAGSGKTSVMVARAAYAIKKGFVPPERILVLAFNANAAAELQTRIAERLASQGLGIEGLRASTFHSFGLAVIGEATGIKPRLAPWLDSGQDLAMIMRIVDELRERSATFRYRWDLYRLVFARTGSTPEGGEGDWFDNTSKTTGHRTLRNEVVKSQGEKLIADWLYLNGISYEYERRFDHAVADAEHSQYQPDFYYPDIDVWHEHWALGHDGKPPESFVGYAEGMQWKKGVHRRFGTVLIETTWAEILDTSGFDAFESELRQRGLEPDWSPDRPTPGSKPVEHHVLAKLVRSFMSHVKSNSLTSAVLHQRVQDRSRGMSRYRSHLFLELYWEIHQAWEERLRQDDYVDFEDMLGRAAAILERGETTAPYDLILVDEFQDSSAARARLVKALLGDGGKYLLTVGDDWQSIYRFAGSDVTVMTDFETWFGPSETLRLQKTFRSTQTITDTAATFISKNPRQITKSVTSAQGLGGPAIKLIRVAAANPNFPNDDLRRAVSDELDALAERIATGSAEPGPDGRVTVDVL